jgi:hypothetical protein
MHNCSPTTEGAILDEVGGVCRDLVDDDVGSSFTGVDFKSEFLTVA